MAIQTCPQCGGIKFRCIALEQLCFRNGSGIRRLQYECVKCGLTTKPMESPVTTPFEYENYDNTTDRLVSIKQIQIVED